MTGTTYRFTTTDLITGAVRGDHLPITAQNFSRQINGSGMFMGALNLISDDDRANRANIAAVTPRKTVLWVLAGEAIIWAGIIWDWNHMSILDQTLPLSCASVESILQHRLITDTLEFTNADVSSMFRGLIQYALGKTPGGQVAGITYTQAQTGITDSLTFDGTQHQDVASAISTLVTNYGIEYSFRPYRDSSGAFRINADLGYPQLGLPAGKSGLAYNFPGNLLDYRFTATGSSSANRVIASASSTSTAAGGGSGVVFTGTAQDDADLNGGFPLLEMSVQPQGTLYNSQPQVEAYARGYLPSVTDTQLTPMLTLEGGQRPLISETVLGSWAQFTATSPLHPARADGSPGFQGIGRVTGWTVYPPSAQQAEYSWIQLGDMTLTP